MDSNSQELPTSENTKTGTNANDGFQALPEGALVGSETYFVTHICFEGSEHNVYDAEGTVPVYPCPNLDCGHVNDAEQTRCQECGMSLDGVVPVRRRYQVYEYRQFSTIEVAAAMAEAGLKHPGLLVPDFFSETPYGDQPRHYLVLPGSLSVLANQVQVPQKSARVLKWGAQLAEALAYLHENNLGWESVGLDHVALKERNAVWVDFSTARQLSENEAEATQQRADDVIALTRIVFFLATGLKDYDPNNDLPPAARRVFEQAFITPTVDIDLKTLAEGFRGGVVSVRRPDTIHLRRWQTYGRRHGARPE